MCIRDRFKAERKADEAQQRREAEAERRAGGLPSPAAVQQCLNTVGRMNIDSSRRAELESECTLTGQVAPVYNETYQQPYYNYGGGYHRPYPCLLYTSHHRRKQQQHGRRRDDSLTRRHRSGMNVKRPSGRLLVRPSPFVPGCAIKQA